MNKVLYIFFLSCFTLVLQAQKTDFSGLVNAQEQPLEDAQVVLKGKDYFSAVITAANGGFNFKQVPWGQYAIQVQKMGYAPYHTEIVINQNTQKLSVELFKDALELNQMVVTGTRQKVPMYETPIIVNKISSKTFESTQSLSAAEGLNFSPGLRVENNCQNCGFTQLRMNGLEGAYSQVLINSRPVFSALAGVYGLEMIPPNMIDRIEVVKGGGSALYGGNAIGGTVNIITKDPIEDQFEIGVNQAFTNLEASDRTLQFSGSVVSDDLRKGMTAYGFNRERAFWDANGDGFSELTALRNTTFGLDAFVKNIHKSKLRLHINAINEWRRGGNEFSREPHQTDLTEQIEHTILGGGLTYERMSDNERHRFSAYTSLQYTQRDSYYGAGGRILEPGDTLTDADLIAINAYGQSEDLAAIAGLQYHFMWRENLLLTAGTEYQYNDVIDQMPGYGREIDQQVGTLGSYGQLEWDPTDKLCIVAGGRLDYISIQGNYLLEGSEFENNRNLTVLVPRANVKYTLTDGLQARASFAQGYRAPQAFDEDLHIETVGGAARFIRLSPDLRNERSNSYTASLNYTQLKNKTQWNLVAEGFHTQLIDPFILSNQQELPNGIAVIDKRNGDEAWVQGINLEANFAYTSKWVIQSGFTAQKAVYTSTEVLWESESGSSSLAPTTTDRILRTPNFYGFFTLNYNPSDLLRLSVSGLYTGSMDVAHVIDPETEYTVIKTTPEFFEANVKAAYDILLQANYYLELFGGVQNLFNSFQNDFDTGANRDAGYNYGPLRPRTVFGGLKLKFN